ncbi:hypothetical protein GF319_10300 [Candidatus Bathyarchaeota archaeon]|nr:hypothetical protein [Candidatus Bathyarchaeota archaeon]
MRNINSILEAGEQVIKKQASVYDQGIGNQSDGTLYLTNRSLIFHVNQNTMYRGLELIIEGEKNAHIEFIKIPLENITNIDKKRLSIEVFTAGSYFREIEGRKYLLGPKGYDRSFEIEQSSFKFTLGIFADKEEWVNLINQNRNSLAPSEPTPPKEISQKEQVEATAMREKIIIKEIVKIKCPYCGTLNDQTSSRCQHCGARIN